ncbi:MAG: 16S rRNA (adenine(1518)-N(6)/adenine(1519)-N(6))-dimethyltransferase RsmA [Myxococcota bacterium]
MTQNRAEFPPWEDPRRTLKRHALRPKRSFSQNFLISSSICDRIAAGIPFEAGRTIVELGPGLGTLTRTLLRTARHVIGVERDRDMIAVLHKDLVETDCRFEVRAGDAAELNLSELAAETGVSVDVVGNLPYASTGRILRNLTRHRTAVHSAILMVQREVRDRLVAVPATKEYGALSVFVQASFAVSTIAKVSRTAFHPPPKVESAVVALLPNTPPLAEEHEGLRRVVRASFQKRRKTLRNALLGRGWSQEEIDTALQTCSIDGRRRGETLAVEEFALLAESLPSVQPEPPPQD